MFVCLKNSDHHSNPILFVRSEISKLESNCVDGSEGCFFFYMTKTKNEDDYNRIN